MRILVADRLPTYVESTMRAAGHECVIDPGLTEASLPEAVGDIDVLVVRSTKVTADTLSASRLSAAGGARRIGHEHHRLRGGNAGVACSSPMSPDATRLRWPS